VLLVLKWRKKVDDWKEEGMRREEEGTNSGGGRDEEGR
jgi:hypothetical protein